MDCYEVKKQVEDACGALGDRMYCEREGDLVYMYSLLFIDYLDHSQPHRKASSGSRWAFDTLLIAELPWGGDRRLAKLVWSIVTSYSYSPKMLCGEVFQATRGNDPLCYKLNLGERVNRGKLDWPITSNRSLLEAVINLTIQ